MRQQLRRQGYLELANVLELQYLGVDGMSADRAQHIISVPARESI